MSQTITIDIAADGTVSIDAEGFTGNSCAIATKQLEYALAGGGKVKKDEKPEFYSPPATNTGHVDTRVF